MKGFIYSLLIVIAGSSAWALNAPITQVRCVGAGANYDYNLDLTLNSSGEVLKAVDLAVDDRNEISDLSLVDVIGNQAAYRGLVYYCR